jgi:hypothetical protein
MDEVYKPSNSECYIPLSEPFKFYLQGLYSRISINCKYVALEICIETNFDDEQMLLFDPLTAKP